MSKYDRYCSLYHLQAYLLEPTNERRRTALRVVQAARILRQIQRLLSRAHPREDLQALRRLEYANTRFFKGHEPSEYLNVVDRIVTIKNRDAPRRKNYFAATLVLRCFIGGLNSKKDVPPAIWRAQAAAKATIQHMKRDPSVLREHHCRIGESISHETSYVEDQWAAYKDVSHILLAIVESPHRVVHWNC